MFTNILLPCIKSHIGSYFYLPVFRYSFQCEQEISKVTDEYQTLEQKSRKLQQWEAAYRQKLEEENKKLSSENRNLKGKKRLKSSL